MRTSSTLAKNFYKSRAFFLMLLPGSLFLIAFKYIPMAGVLMAFKSMRFMKGNIFANFIDSPWFGFKNFEFFFKSPDAFIVTRNTVLYNLAFIVIGLVAAVSCAITMNELHSKLAARFYQSIMILPHFLSWVVVSYLLYAFLNPSIGLVNTGLKNLFGMDPISWYTTKKYWPFFFVLLNLWKGVGYGSIIYFAAITGIDPELFQSAQIDGASKWKQIRHITIPCLAPQMFILVILSLGKIFDSDFGLFWTVTLNLGNGMLYDVGSTIDTYVYNALRNSSDFGMPTAVGLYQNVVGLITILSANLLVRKINPDHSLF